MEITMLKPILAGAAALAIAGASLAYAQQPQDRPDRGPADRTHGWQFSPEDRAAFIEAGIAALRAGLQLSGDQERHWGAFETAIRDLVRNRQERREAWRNQPQSNDPTEQLRRRADALSSAGAALKRLAEAQGPLYASLDEGQKRRFAMLARRLSPGMAGTDGGMGGMMGRQGMGPGYGMRGRHGHGMGHHHGWDRDRMGEGPRGDGWRRDDDRDRRWRDHHGWRGERDRDGRDDRPRDGRGMMRPMDQERL
jgi:hypothetical protein